MSTAELRYLRDQSLDLARELELLAHRVVTVGIAVGLLHDALDELTTEAEAVEYDAADAVLRIREGAI